MQVQITIISARDLSAPPLISVVIPDIDDSIARVSVPYVFNLTLSPYCPNWVNDTWTMTGLPILVKHIPVRTYLLIGNTITTDIILSGIIWVYVESVAIGRAWEGIGSWQSGNTSFSADIKHLIGPTCGVSGLSIVADIIPVPIVWVFIDMIGIGWTGIRLGTTATVVYVAMGTGSERRDIIIANIVFTRI